MTEDHLDEKTKLISRGSKIKQWVTGSTITSHQRSAPSLTCLRVRIQQPFNPLAIPFRSPRARWDLHGVASFVFSLSIRFDFQVNERLLRSCCPWFIPSP